MESHQTEPLFDCANVLNPLICKRCTNFTTHKLVHLTRHYRTHHNKLVELEETNYKCSRCKFQTCSNFAFERHKKFNLCRRSQKKTRSTSSAQIEAYMCKYCSYKTPHFGRLRYHLVRKHTFNEQFEYCPKKNKVKHHLERHMYRKHTKTLKDSSPIFDHRIWKEHSYSMLDLRGFQCEHCTYRTNRSWNLKLHQQNVHSTDALKCKYYDSCQFETNSQGKLRRHETLRHNPYYMQLLKYLPRETKTTSKPYLKCVSHLEKA